MQRGLSITNLKIQGLYTYNSHLIMHFNWRVIKTFAFRTAPRHQLSLSQTGSTVTRQSHLKMAQSDEFQNTILI